MWKWKISSAETYNQKFPPQLKVESEAFRYPAVLKITWQKKTCRYSQFKVLSFLAFLLWDEDVQLHLLFESLVFPADVFLSLYVMNGQRSVLNAVTQAVSGQTLCEMERLRHDIRQILKGV